MDFDQAVADLAAQLEALGAPPKVAQEAAVQGAAQMAQQDAQGGPPSSIGDLVAAQHGAPTQQPGMTWSDVWQNTQKAFGDNPHQQQLMRGLGAAASSAADPLNIPSAAVGLVAPQARDAWRAHQSSEGALPQMAGALAGGIGGMNVALRGAATVPSMMARGAAAGAASDVVDEAAGGTQGIGTQTAGKAMLGAAAGAPLRVAAPLAGTGGGVVQAAGDQAEAQGVDRAGVEQRLRAMSRPELQAFQQSNGLDPDGRIGPATMAKAVELAATDQARRGVEAEQGRIRAQGEASAAVESAKIKAQGEADAAREKAASDLKASEARRPFTQRNPEYSTYAPWIAGGASALVPIVASALSRKAATAPQRQAAQAVDDAVAAYRGSPSPVAGRTAGTAAKDFNDARAAPAPTPTGMDRAIDAGTVGTAATLPTAAVMAPNVIDYAQQPADSEAYKQAAQQFTMDKMLERLWGPTSMGLMLAGTGRLVGDKAAAATINPAPQGANLPYAKELGRAAAGKITPEQSQSATAALTAEGTRLQLPEVTPSRLGITSLVEDALRGTPPHRMQRALEKEPMYDAMSGAERARQSYEKSRLAQRQDAAAADEVARATGGDTGGGSRASGSTASGPGPSGPMGGGADQQPGTPLPARGRTTEPQRASEPNPGDQQTSGNPSDTGKSVSRRNGNKELPAPQGRSPYEGFDQDVLASLESLRRNSPDTAARMAADPAVADTQLRSIVKTLTRSKPGQVDPGHVQAAQATLKAWQRSAADSGEPRSVGDLVRRSAPRHHSQLQPRDRGGRFE